MCLDTLALTKARRQASSSRPTKPLMRLQHGLCDQHLHSIVRHHVGIWVGCEHWPLIKTTGWAIVAKAFKAISHSQEKCNTLSGAKYVECAKRLLYTRERKYLGSKKKEIERAWFMWVHRESEKGIICEFSI